MEKLNKEFFNRPAPIVAKELIGKIFCANIDGQIVKSMITETEAYLGPEDSASHARFGESSHAKVMWAEPGTIYVYLCYGMHNMFNITTSSAGDPQAVLFRGVKDACGPGKFTKYFKIDKYLNNLNILSLKNYWIEDAPAQPCVSTGRIGIGFAKPCDQKRKLRFVIKNLKKQKY